MRALRCLSSPACISCTPCRMSASIFSSPERPQIDQIDCSDTARTHFQSRLALETDYWDVHEDFRTGQTPFVLLDVRGEASFLKARVPGAVNLPPAQINRDTLPPIAEGEIYVIYCAGPHCNGAQKAAAKIAALGLPVKEMIGGVAGWKTEGFDFARG